MAERKGASGYGNGDCGGSYGDYCNGYEHGFIKGGLRNTVRSYIGSMTGRIGRFVARQHAPKVLGGIGRVLGVKSAAAPKVTKAISKKPRRPRVASAPKPANVTGLRVS